MSTCGEKSRLGQREVRELKAFAARRRRLGPILIGEERLEELAAARVTEDGHLVPLARERVAAARARGADHPGAEGAVEELPSAPEDELGCDGGVANLIVQATRE